MSMKKLLPVVVMLLGGCAATPISGVPGNVDNTQRAQEEIGAWTPNSKLQAQVLLEKYGAPDEVRADSLVWIGRGPWDRIDVWNAPVGGEDNALLMETVGYPMSQESAASLKRFDPRLVCDPATGRLSARSDSEEKNYLLLNLADDVVNGRKTPDDARVMYKDILDRSYSGKGSPYLRGLLFRFGSVK